MLHRALLQTAIDRRYAQMPRSAAFTMFETLAGVIFVDGLLVALFSPPCLLAWHCLYVFRLVVRRVLFCFITCAGSHLSVLLTLANYKIFGKSINFYLKCISTLSGTPVKPIAFRITRSRAATYSLSTLFPAFPADRLLSLKPGQKEATL